MKIKRNFLSLIANVIVINKTLKKIFGQEFQLQQIKNQLNRISSLFKLLPIVIGNHNFSVIVQRRIKIKR